MSYGMQPAQPQYGAPQPQYGAPQPQYGAPQPQYGAQQQQYMPPQQQNPYAADSTEPTAQTNETVDEDAGKDIYTQQENPQEQAWKFTPVWDEASELTAKTACCCCSCAFDDCQDVMQIQCQSVCLCLDSAITWRLFQCQDQSQRACCLNTSKVSMCDFTSPDEDVMCSFWSCGINGVFCLCCSGKAYEAICDPCKMPDTCVKQLCQCLCIHARVALPCDDEVPFEIGCCGFMCKEEEKAEAEE